ncbi:hypothetical protein [Parageobacillus thermoglucosidasius]|uniref:hypothetical protein n=1 Tax=Parageobacillus thermoglucosidasius TaxID=1426 RepID=UPI000A7335BF|nr:hypothetical protein [Parageobacillus thermoglucosidasius]
MQGIIAAKEAAEAANAQVKIGFAAVLDHFGPVVPEFWESIFQLGRRTFVESLDYVGYNFYADVFEASIDLKTGFCGARAAPLSRKNLKTAHIPESVPIRITENGWPTGKHPFTGEDRSYEHQAKVLEAVIRTVYALRQELNITHYELFGLRDADSSVHDLFHQFGIMRDDYTPKPAFYTFQRLIQELGV